MVARTSGVGGYAGRAMVAAEAVVAVPNSLDLTVAAALLHDGATALVLFDTTKIGSDEGVGGRSERRLGALCVQLARSHAGPVVAVAHGEKLDRLAQLEPDAIVDSARPDWIEQARAVLGP